MLLDSLKLRSRGGRAIAALLAVVVVGGFSSISWFAKTDKQTQFQGYMEGNLVLVGPEESGRIAAMRVVEGDVVSQGGEMFSIDDELMQAALKEARARLDVSRAQLADLQEQQERPEQIAVLEAEKRRAKAAYDYANKELKRIRRLFQRKVVAGREYDLAKANFERDKAALQEVERKIAAAHLAARSKTIEAAQASVKAAQASVKLAKIRLEKLQVLAPVSGRVEQVHFRAGEVVSAGAPVISLLPPENIKVRFFVPEPALSGMRLGGLVQISCDGCGDQYQAKISFISREAEYTPPIIFGPKERAKLVFKVEARPVKAAKRLAPGLPVTVVLKSSGQS